MKKSAIFGAISGIGMMMMIVAGKRCPGLSWNSVALIVGTSLTTLGMSHFSELLKEVMDELTESHYATVDRDSDNIRPFNLPSGRGSRTGTG